MARATGAGAGDFTGRKKAQLAKEHQAQVADKSRQVAMVTEVSKSVSDEVVDYTKERQAPPEDTGPVDLTGPQPPRVEESSEEEDPIIAAAVAQQKAAERAERGDVTPPEEDPELLGQNRAADFQQRQATQVSPIRAQKSKVKIRARESLEQVTIGKGTFYDFEEGRQYLVPPNVANHLAERELVDILG